MASSSSRSGPVLERERGPNAPRKYDVFISFRGDDTRYNFTSHLHAALKRSFLEVFLDDCKIDTGDEIKPSLIQAIKDSSVSVIVFSEDYASSKWCLDELAEIMQYRKEKGQFVIPIFYKVDPSDVRNQTGAYKKAFEKHGNDKVDPDRVSRWRAALFEAGNLKGKPCEASTDETKLIQEIVSDVRTKLELIPNWQVTSFKDVIGKDEMIEPIKELLEKSHEVGIWGIGGVGKTTMAKVVFAKLSSEYDSRCFLENVREKTEQNGLEHVRNSLVSELLGEDVQIKSSNEEFVLRRLGRTKALVVLDDVDTTKQLEHLLDKTCDVLGKGSKVIITTRDQKLLKGRKDYEIYEVKGLSYENSRRLFIHKAFGSDNPKDGYEALIEGFVDYTKHNPLALEVLGSHVCSEDEQLWRELLRKLQDGNPYEKIHKVLRLSYDILDHNEKQIFLDIACFLKGEGEGFVKELMMSYGFYPNVGMQTLKDKALIKTIDGKVQMHDLIQEMGHQIVREESINKPEKRSRLWNSNEISDVFKNCKEAKEVEGIAGWISPSVLTAKTFKKMRRLRFLKIFSLLARFLSDTSIQLSFKSFSTQIRYFHWEGYPSESLPSNFCAEHLLELNLKHSLVETLWEGVQDLVNLRRLNLLGCIKLKEIPDFSKACRLERVDLSYCRCLCKGHESLLTLHSLISLDLNFCYKLESLQSRIHLRSLKKINILGCKGLKEFSVSSEELTSLELSFTNIEELNPSIVRCSKLRKLCLYPTNLKNFPIEVLSCLTSLEELQVPGQKIDNDVLQKLFDRLRSLQILRLTECWNLTELPDNITQLSSLEQLVLGDCSKLTNLPVNIKLLPKLQYLSVTGCIKLRSLPELPPSLSTLNVQHCKSLETVSFSMPLSLESLQLEECPNLTKLPNNIRNLSKLQDLSVKSCILLQSIPDLPPSLRKLIAKNCTSLETMPISTISSTTENYGEKIFSFINCEKLDLGAIEEQAKLLFEKANHEKEDVTVWYTGEKVPVWFGNNRTQKDSNTLKLSLSSHTLVGFIFCVVITVDIFPAEDRLQEDRLRAIKYFHDLSILFNVEEDEETREELRVFNYSSPVKNLIPGNVLLCSSPKVSQSILKKIEGDRRNHEAATYNPNLSLQLGFDRALTGEFCPIEGWGVYPVYSEVNSNSRKRKAM